MEITNTLQIRQTAVGDEDLAVDVGGFVGGEEEEVFGDFGGGGDHFVDVRASLDDAHAVFVDIGEGFEDLGLDATGGDGVATDVLVAVHGGGVADEAVDGVFRHGVGDTGLTAADAGNGGGGDNGPAFLHEGNSSLKGPEGPLDVDSKNMVQGLFAAVGDGFKVVHNTRISDQNIQATILRLDLAEDPVDILGFREVGRQGDDLTGVGLVFGFLDHAVQPFLTAGYSVNFAALLGCQERGSPAYARGSSSNDHNLVGKSHAKYLPFLASILTRT